MGSVSSVHLPFLAAVLLLTTSSSSLFRISTLDGLCLSIREWSTHSSHLWHDGGNHTRPRGREGGEHVHVMVSISTSTSHQTVIGGR